MKIVISSLFARDDSKASQWSKIFPEKVNEVLKKYWSNYKTKIEAGSMIISYFKLDSVQTKVSCLVTLNQEKG